MNNKEKSIVIDLSILTVKVRDDTSSIYKIKKIAEELISKIEIDNNNNVRYKKD